MSHRHNELSLSRRGCPFRLNFVEPHSPSTRTLRLPCFVFKEQFRCSLTGFVSINGEKERASCLMPASLAKYPAIRPTIMMRAFRAPNVCGRLISNAQMPPASVASAVRLRQCSVCGSFRCGSIRCGSFGPGSQCQRETKRRAKKAGVPT